jgi:hypothetical protein
MDWRNWKGDGVLMAAISSALLQIFSSRSRASERVAGIGDSFMANASGVGVQSTMAANNKILIQFGAGGATVDAVRDQMINNAAVIRKHCVKMLIWDGSPNMADGEPFPGAAAYTDYLATGIAAVGIDFTIIPSTAPFNGGTAGAVIHEQIRDEFVSRWGSKVYDWRNNIPNTDGVVNADRMLDTIHITQTAHNEAYAGYSPQLP